MTMSLYLTPTKIIARVRNDGAIAVFEERLFEFMLDRCDTPERQVREATRILQQIGYEARGVRLAPDKR